MSIQVMAYVWEHSRHKGSTLLLLLAIADHADDEGIAYPSVPRLARKTRMTDRNVQHAMLKLKDSQELTIHAKAGPGGTHLYQIKRPHRGVKSFQGEKFSSQETRKETSSEIEGENFSPYSTNSRGEEVFTGGVKPASPQPSVNHQKKKKDLKTPSTDAARPSPILGDGCETDSPDFVGLTSKKGGKALPTKRCPINYTPSLTVLQWANRKYPEIDFNEALEAMRDCEFAKAHSDWDATLRTWIRNEAKRQPRRKDQKQTGYLTGQPFLEAIEARAKELGIELT